MHCMQHRVLLLAVKTSSVCQCRLLRDGGTLPVSGHEGRKVVTCHKQSLGQAVLSFDHYATVVCAELALAQPEHPSLRRHI